ncbi:MAG TPA: Holliday junction branch migration protein RuvA [Kofleriaceae bacterium]|nr:Holliday junction branch migration protein RuvA [Kofleriaceae bacterium]
MIGRLKGTIVERAGAQVIVDVGGVGYEITCSGWTLGALPANDEPVTLRIFTQARENDIVLFGFLTEQERALFDLLITVKNVGPSTAIGILSGGSTPRDIAQLIAREEVAGLTRIKGVGKKTAEMLVVELREKCEMLLLTWNASGEVREVAAPIGAIRKARHPMLDEVAGALAQMGWRPIEADKVVAELEVGPGATLEGLLRQALRAMPR